MSLPPPPPLHVGTYKQGDIIGLGKTANLYYPYCVIKVKTWTCTQYAAVDSKGNTIQMLSVPASSEADFYWPQWHPAVDYTSANNKPWVSWKVCYNGFYYEPSMWLTSSQTGQPPSSAEAKVGDRLNEAYQLQNDDKVKKVCKNQSHPIRAWILLGTLEEGNGWNGIINEYRDADPISGDRRRLYYPFSFIENVSDFNKIGGDADGDYYEEYYPKMRGAFIFETYSRKLLSYEESGSTFVRVKGSDAKPGEEDPYSWDIYTGKMSSQDILCSSGYYNLYSDYYWMNQGVSMNLWQQKVVFHTSRKKHVTDAGNGGNSITYKILTSDSVSSSPMPEDKTMFIDYTPGPGMGEPGVYNYVYSQSRGDRTYVPQNNGGTSTETFDMFFTTNHPVVFTRKFNYWTYKYKFVGTSKKALYPGSKPPYYTVVTADTSITYEYSKKNFTSSFNQLHVYGVDKQGKEYTSAAENRVGTYVERSFTNYTTYTTTREDSGVRWTYASWNPD